MHRHRRKLRRSHRAWQRTSAATRRLSVDQIIRLHLAQLIAGLPDSLLPVATDANSGIRSFAGLSSGSDNGPDAAAAVRSYLSVPGTAALLADHILSNRRVRREISAMERRHTWAKFDTNVAEALSARAKGERQATRTASRKSSRFGFPGLVARGAATLVLVLAAGALWIDSGLPSTSQMRHLIRHPSLDVTVDADDAIVLGNPVFPVPVGFDELPQHLIDAVIELEDRRFFQHFGFDPVGIARATVTNIIAKVRHERGLQGASTLTQQVARNAFLTHERTIMRKLREIVLALKLELLLNKREILELYLNRVYFGNGVDGAELAARRYFAERASRLNLYQSAMLVGIIRRPSDWNPERNLVLANRRARLVLDVLVDRGVIAEAVRDRAVDRWGGASLAELRTGDRVVRNVEYRWFRDWVQPRAAQIVAGQTGRFRLVLTLDPLAQIYAQLAAERVMRSGRRRGVGQVAMVAVTTDGSVRAMVGGADYAQNQFNRVTQADRQPALAFKPFVFLAALEAGYGLDTPIDDAPLEVNGRPYPDNFDRRYRGRVRLADALIYSLNAATVRLQEAVGRERVLDVAKRLGLPSGLPDELSLALGSGEVTPLALTAAYAGLAARGRRVVPCGMIAVRRHDGSLLYWREPGRPGPQVIAARHVELLTHMLREGKRIGTGREAAFARDAAGKTGTSQDYRDAWFVGYTGELAASFWLGNDDNRPMRGVTGGSIPARYWNNFMANIYQDRELPALPGISH